LNYASIKAGESMPKKNINRTDPSQNYIDRYPLPLDALFHPKSVAVIGAKDDLGSVGSTIINNLKSGGFKGKIYPINPKRKEVWGLPCYPSISAIPGQVDLVVIVTPAATVPKLVAECTAAHVKSCIIISAGFKELGPSGIKLEEEILYYARKGKMPIIGPNCLGVMNPIHGLNATFARGMALPGNLAFISQSGAMCTAVLDWSYKEKIGFSAFISIGSMADVNWGTLIDYLGNDPHTRSLLLYMETIGDARSFLTAAREVALEKPIIVIKAGRSQAAAKAAASHTGSLAGSDEVFDAALERVGVLRVNSISELFSMASVLSRQPRPRGPKLTIVTNAGGPAVLATDATVLNHAELTVLPEQTIEKLNTFLPTAWSHSNPVDILGDASAETYAKTLGALAEDEKTDGLLVILSPQDMTDPTKTAEALTKYGHIHGKPLLASWMGGDTVSEGAKILNEARIPVFEYPDDAAKTFGMMWRYSQNIQSLYETAVTGRRDDVGQEEFNSNKIKALLHSVQEKRRTLLTEAESKQLLSYYGIPVVETHIAKTSEEAADRAKKMGFPLVLKLSSETITHKTDVGGVKLNLNSINEVLTAFHEIEDSVTSLAGAEHFGGVTVQRMIPPDGYEIILGSSTDPQFGPVLLFGSGGQLVEVYKDSSLAIPPLTNNLARRFMEKTKIYEALKGVRGRKSVDIVALEELLVNFSRLVIENRRIKECDINPLKVSGDTMIALDARIVLHEADILDDDLPKLAIRPYPLNYVVENRLKNGVRVTLRPIRPEDENLIVDFHHKLSDYSVRQRYFEFLSLDERVAHERLIRICFTDYDREWTSVAEIDTDNGKRLIGFARLFLVPGTRIARFVMVIVDEFHNMGLGTLLLQHLMFIAKQENIEKIDAQILSENINMIKICERLGFEISADSDPFITRVQWKVNK
jgi:acetyltransferase